MERIGLLLAVVAACVAAALLATGLHEQLGLSQYRSIKLALVAAAILAYLGWRRYEGRY